MTPFFLSVGSKYFPYSIFHNNLTERKLHPWALLLPNLSLTNLSLTNLSLTNLSLTNLSLQLTNLSHSLPTFVPPPS